MRKIYIVVLCILTVLPALGATSPPYSDKMSERTGRNADIEFAAVPLRTMNMPDAGMYRADNPFSLSGSHRNLPQAALDLPDLCGCVIARTDWTSANAAIGLYKLPSSLGEEFTLDIAKLNATHGGIAVGDTYYATWANDFGTFTFVNIAAYDLSSGALSGGVPPTNSYEAICYDTALDPVTNQVWAITYNANKTSCQLTKIKYASPVTTESVGLLDGQWSALAADAQGELWGIRKVLAKDGEADVCIGSELVRLNKSDASYTVIGATGQAPEYLSSATIDTCTGRMFWAVSTAAGEGYLCEVNLSTGAATKLMDFPGNAEITGLIVKSPTIIGSVPSAPEDLSASFPEGSLSGHVSFTVPSVLFDGTAASGSVSYKVKVGDRIVAQGSAAYGDTVSEPVTVSETGMLEITVILSNEAGESPEAKISCFVGCGVPESPRGVHASWTAGKMTVSWEPVTASVDGGYINPADVRYKIETADGSFVRDDVEATQVETDVPEPDELTSYSYIVTAICNGLASTPVESNTVSLGVAYPPYDASILSKGEFDSFTVVDANKDGNTWIYTDKKAQVMMHNLHDTDDWLITVPIYLEAGQVYNISTSVFGSAFSDERFELKIGRAATPEAMTETLIAPTDLNKVAEYELHEADYTPSESGAYYIGLHGISTRFQFSLCTHGIYVSEGQIAERPDAGRLIAIPSRDGKYEMTLEMTAPDKDLSGGKLASILKSELYRGETLLKTWDNPAPGGTWSYLDIVGQSGDVTYTFVSYTAGGVGKSVSVTEFCGTPKPAAVTGIVAIDNSADGTLTLRWNAVTTDVDGNPLDSGNVKYALYAVNEGGQTAETIAENLTSATYTYAVPDLDGEQRFMQWAVSSVTEGGENIAVSELLPVGRPYDGLEDSFTDGEAHYIYGFDSKGTTAAWILADDRTFMNIAPYDGDGGYLYLMAGYYDESAGFVTGRISLRGMMNPCLKFYTVPWSDKNFNTITVKVRKVGQSAWDELHVTRMNEIYDGSGWSQILVPLTDYEDKVIQVCIEAAAISYQYAFVDKLAVEPLVDHDLRVNAITGPKKAKAGYEFPLNVVVENKGTMTTGAYTVELYAGSQCVSTAAGEPGLLPEGKTVVTVSAVMDRFAEEGMLYSAKVSYDKDMVPGNDTGPDTFIPCIEPSYPGVDNLQGAYCPQANSLSWMEPALDYPDRPTFESFEHAEPWDQEYEDWIFVDRDGSPTGAFNDFYIPGIRPGYAASSFFIFDTSDVTLNETFDPVSGSKFLAAMYRLDNETTDDWAISPELTGKEQSLSFFAKSYRSIYPERIEVYYSTGSVNPDDFILLEDGVIEQVPAAWTCYDFTLPEGADRFAIRSCAAGGLLLMLDDFDFVAASVTKDLELRGYDIWRDARKMNDEPLVTVAWDDHNRLSSTTHLYTVIPVYNRGEGKSARVSIGDSESVDEIDASGIIVSRSGKFIKVTGAEGLAVTLTDTMGNVLWRGIGTPTTLIPASSGLMIVKAGAKVVKLMITP